MINISFHSLRCCKHSSRKMLIEDSDKDFVLKFLDFTVSLILNSDIG